MIKVMDKLDSWLELRMGKYFYKTLPWVVDERRKFVSPGKKGIVKEVGTAWNIEAHSNLRGHGERTLG